MNECSYHSYMITRKQKEFLNKLQEAYSNGLLPSFEQICKDLGYKSKNSIWQYFTKLMQQGFIKEINNRFFLSQELLGVSYFESGVRAGFPSIAEDYPAEKLSFDSLLIKSPVATFSVRVIGDSMIEAGIYENDIAVVEKGQEPKNGDIVVAIVDGEFTLKFYFKEKGEALLKPANKAYPVIKARNELRIFGVVTGIVRKLKP
jgi:SOS regulatory protein LexA